MEHCPFQLLYHHPIPINLNCRKPLFVQGFAIRKPNITSQIYERSLPFLQACNIFQWLFCSQIAKKLKRKQGLETQRKKSEQIVIVPLNHWCTFVHIKNTAEIKKMTLHVKSYYPGEAEEQ